MDMDPNLEFRSGRLRYVQFGQTDPTEPDNTYGRMQMEKMINCSEWIGSKIEQWTALIKLSSIIGSNTEIKYRISDRKLRWYDFQ